MKQVLTMNGGINKDVHPMYIDAEQGQVLSRKNCRVFSTDGNKAMVNSTIRGMQEINPSYPTGTNKTIGFVEDKERDRALFFVYNSVGNHDIYILDNDVVTPLNADPDVLAFDPDEIIDADILGDYCVFTSEYNPPRKIDIGLDDLGTQKELDGLDEYDIQLAVRPPMYKPSVSVGSDSTRVVNKLVGKTFQFATMFVYDDYTYSVLSPYSDIVVSSSVFAASDNTYENNAVGNYVNVTYDLGYANVREVRLLAREGNNGLWFVVDEYETGGSTGTRTHPFYNDVARKGLSEQEALALYSDVPRMARTVKVAQNRVGLGNILKGYDKTSPLVSFGVEYDDISISSTSNDLSATIECDALTGDFEVRFEIPASGSISEGDLFSVNIRGRLISYYGSDVYSDFTFEYNKSYTVTAADIIYGAQDALFNMFTSDILSKGSDIVDYYSYYGGIADPDATINVYGYHSGSDVIILFNSSYRTGDLTNINFYNTTYTQDTLPSGVSTHKSGSYKNVGILFYDDFGRTSGVLSPQKVYVPHLGERDTADAYRKAKISFEIEDDSIGVMDNAKYYRFACTESVNFAGVYPFATGGTDNIAEIYLDGKQVIAINMPTNLQYEFAKGDYLQLEVGYDSTAKSAITNTVTKEIIGTRSIVEISGTETAGFWLIVPKKLDGTDGASTYDGSLAYIYRPKDTVEDLVYFECSETYEVVNGEMQTLSGYIGGEDAWYVQRTFEWSASDLTEVVEDFYISVDSAIRAYSKGRVTVEFDTLGEIRLQDFVWSFNYLDNTKVNGISTFNALNRIQLDEKDGDIQRLELVGDVLKVIQDNKETSMYIGKSQMSDASGNLQLVLSNNFIGAKNPSENDYGSRYPLSIVQNNRNIFYWDGDKGEVVRSSPNGQFPVSSYGMKSEFLRIKKDIDSAYDKDSTRVFSYFDEKNYEYVITFVIDGDVETFVFKEGDNIWMMNNLELTDSHDLPADFYGNIGSQVYSFGFQRAWKHEATPVYNWFYGTHKSMQLKGVVSTPQREEKCFRAIEIDSRRGIWTKISSPVSPTHTIGQETLLYKDTYRKRNGKYTSSVFKNVLIPAGTDLSLLHEGEDMVGQYFTIEFIDADLGDSQLRLVTATLDVNN